MMWVLEPLVGTLVLLLVLALVAPVLVLPLLVHVLMLQWVRTFVPCWALAQLMLLVMQVLVQTLVWVWEGLVRPLVMLVQTLALLVLTGGDSGNPAGVTKSMMKSGMSTARRRLRWKLVRTESVARTMRTTRPLVTALARGPLRNRSKRTCAWRLRQRRRTLTGPGWPTLSARSSTVL